MLTVDYLFLVYTQRNMLRMWQQDLDKNFSHFMAESESLVDIFTSFTEFEIKAMN